MIMKTGTTISEMTIARIALGDGVLAEGRPDVLFLERLGVEARRQAPLDRRTVIRIVEFLGRESLPCEPPSMIPESRIS